MGLLIRFDLGFIWDRTRIHLRSDSKMLNISFLNIARGALRLSDLLLEVSIVLVLVLRRASGLRKVARSRQLWMT